MHTEYKVGDFVSLYYDTCSKWIRLHDWGEIVQIDQDNLKIIRYDKSKVRTNAYINVKIADIKDIKRL